MKSDVIKYIHNVFVCKQQQEKIAAQKFLVEAHPYTTRAIRFFVACSSNLSVEIEKTKR